jgi:hypothetical protein
MVLAARSDTGTIEVTAAVAQAYAGAGDTVVEAALADLVDDPGVPGSAVIAADSGVIECVLEDGSDPAALGPGIARLAAAGWAVVTVVPVSRLGEAHRALRRRPARVQPWWADPRDGICFGVPEVL